MIAQWQSAGLNTRGPGSNPGLDFTHLKNVKKFIKILNFFDQRGFDLTFMVLFHTIALPYFN